ncbi:MAG: heat-inducible transcriptional repressor HrcA [Anderseniella sp.]
MKAIDDRLTELSVLDKRSRDIFRRLVETFLETGGPVGSRTISRHLPVGLSPASIRNVMSDLEQAGLIYSPHTSAGRMPTQTGLRFFVDALMEVGRLTPEERAQIDGQIAGLNREKTTDDILSDATNLLSGLSSCAGLVLSTKANVKLRHIEFVSINPCKALVIIVSEDGSVENRTVEIPRGLPASTLTQVSNFLNSRCQGLSITELKGQLGSQLQLVEKELDSLATKVIEAGLAVWSDDAGDGKRSLIVRGRSHLIGENAHSDDIERIRRLFDDLENKKDVMDLLGLAESGEGVRIFIGSETNLFSLSGSSLVVAPYRDSKDNIIGVLGVVGPTRLNYTRIVPMVDYTAQAIGRLIS